MIVNRTGLLRAAPIKDMLTTKVQGPLTSYGLTECGYDIRIAESIHFTGKHNRELHPMVQIEPVNAPARHVQGYLALGSSMEEFNMPTFLMGRVLNKSTWARKGLDASMTTNIEPGWRGFLTIELIYHGMDDLIIPAGSGICQVIFETIQENAIYIGKYQDQEAGPQEARTGTKQDNGTLAASMYGRKSSGDTPILYEKGFGPGDGPSKVICSADGCSRTEDCGPFCRNRN